MVIGRLNSDIFFSKCLNEPFCYWPCMSAVFALYIFIILSVRSKTITFWSRGSYTSKIYLVFRQNILIFNKQSRNPFRFINSRRWCGGYNFPVHYHLSILDNNHHDSTVAARHVYYQTTKFYCALFLQSHGRVPTVAGWWSHGRGCTGTLQARPGHRHTTSAALQYCIVYCTWESSVECQEDSQEWNNCAYLVRYQQSAVSW